MIPAYRIDGVRMSGKNTMTVARRQSLGFGLLTLLMLATRVRHQTL
jgi:hypothetical protein